MAVDKIKSFFKKKKVPLYWLQRIEQTVATD
jgi:hypothetical protein